MDRYGDALALGVESMDTEHRRLAVMFGEFSDCIKDGGRFDQALQIVQEALALTNVHFANEEALMKRYAYPGIEDEKLQHRNLRLQITTLVGDSLNTGFCDQVTLENLATIERLLYEHISGADRSLARYLIAKGAR